MCVQGSWCRTSRAPGRPWRAARRGRRTGCWLSWRVSSDSSTSRTSSGTSARCTCSGWRRALRACRTRTTDRPIFTKSRYYCIHSFSLSLGFAFNEHASLISWSDHANFNDPYFSHYLIIPHEGSLFPLQLILECWSLPYLTNNQNFYLPCYWISNDTIWFLRSNLFLKLDNIILLILNFWTIFLNFHSISYCKTDFLCNFKIEDNHPRQRNR